ncbi:hypothetical protein [Pseudonocardia dioxanivorans]|uniref:hypothetical protein n=1 Tax=Pseudonocardia dioxanivorans TaxID=240495 RepID=UPI00131A601C|nr:hypothetical protein [Pseudonocardia dioxanivorans]GJF05586.1 hypothetical protein PSD17_45370 [Pseudonocardia sp. D17]
MSAARTPSRREAVDAARRLLQSKVDVVADLADAGSRVDQAEAAAAAAEDALREARLTYKKRFDDAVRAGWTEPELAEAGLTPERGHLPRGRRRQRRTNPPAGGEVAAVEHQHPGQNIPEAPALAG